MCFLKQPSHHGDQHCSHQHQPLPSELQDGQPAITITSTTPSSAPSKGKKGGSSSTSTAGATTQLEADWIAEHARQVSRMLPGGLEVLGLYLLAPEAAWTSAAGQLCTALTTMAADSSTAGAADGSGRSLLVLHVDSLTRKMTARSCACVPAPAPSGLRVVELRSGSAVGSLVRLATVHKVDATLPAVAGAAGGGSGKARGGDHKQQLQHMAESLVDAEAARLEGALAALRGNVLPEGAVIGDHLPADCSLDVAAHVQLFCALPAASAAAAAAAGTGDSAAAMVPNAAPLHGSGSLHGEMCGVAYVHRREPATKALAELKADVVKSLRARLDLLIEEALAAADEQQQDEGNQQQPGGAAKPVAHPLLLGAGSGKSARLALPRRVLLPWQVAGAALRVCDYLVEGEGPDAAVVRAQELLGLGDEEVAVAQVEELEAPAGTAKPPAKVKGAAVAAVGGGSSAAACSNTVIAGLAAGAAAALAVAVGYLNMSSR